LYARRLDKIYQKHGKSPMLPKVVKKMRDEYAENPHEFYKMVCQKYGETPEKEIDAYRLVYGRTEFENHDYEFDKNKRENEEKERKEVQAEVKEEESPTSEDEEEEEEEEEEDEPEKPQKERSYKFKMPERRSSPRFDSSSYRRSSPRYESRSSPREERRSSPRYERRSSPREERRSSPRNERRYAPSLPKINYDRPSSSRKQLDSPRVGSPRALYHFHRKEQLDYVNVHPGDIVETMVLTGKSGSDESGFWIPARILSINEDAKVMDLQVLQPVKYGLADRAVSVPYRYVRKPANIVWKR